MLTFKRAGKVRLQMYLHYGRLMMSDRFGNLGDLFPDKEEKCRVRGCNNRVHIPSESLMKDISHGRKPQARMCDECLALYNTLEDKEIPCDRPGCEGKWTWTRFQQLEHIRSGKSPDNPPRRMCDSCFEASKDLKPIEHKCRIKNCNNTWTLSAREQLALGDKPAPHKMCDECFKLLNTLSDKELPCRVNGCDHTYTWTRFQQLEHIRSGKSLDNPPRRMCDSCFEIFKDLKPIEQKCRVKGCDKTWTYTTYDQLESIVKARKAAAESGQGDNPAEVPVPPPPSRMCKECFDFFNQATDEQMPCKNKFCKNTWTYTRSMKLAHKHFEHPYHPSKYCEECAKKLETLEDKQLPCKQEGCSGTWTYGKEDQLKDLTAGRSPQPRFCHECNEFMREHPAYQADCEKCGKKIDVTSLLQLRVKLGVSKLPTLCADCARDSLQAELASEDSHNPITRPKIYIPKNGAWSASPVTCKLPLRISEDIVAKMGEATYRIVCLGDEFVFSCDDEPHSWPYILERNLKEKYGADLSLFNAGMASCTAELGLKRFERDVAPFKPQLVIVSFAMADALDAKADISDDELNARLAAFSESMAAIWGAIRSIDAKPLCVIPNPVNAAESPDGKHDTQVAERRAAIYDQFVKALRRSAADVPIVDARAMYALTGEQTSRIWMSSWCMHNDTGAASIANWVKDEVVGDSLLDGAKKIVVDGVQE